MQASTSAASDGYFQARASQLRHSMSRSHSRGSSPSSASKSRAAVAAARAPLSSSTRRPSPLRSSQYQQVAPLTRKALDWANDQMTTVSKEMENLLELKYRGDIQEYMYHMEVRSTTVATKLGLTLTASSQLKTMPSIELIDMQPEIQWFMRKYLMEFIIEVHQQHALRAETLYLAVNILDRYVSKRIVFKKHYQLVGW